MKAECLFSDCASTDTDRWLQTWNKKTVHLCADHSPDESTGHYVKVDAPEQEITLAETSNLLRIIASAEIAAHGEYFCLYDGKRTRVIA